MDNFFVKILSNTDTVLLSEKIKEELTSQKKRGFTLLSSSFTSNLSPENNSVCCFHVMLVFEPISDVIEE